MLARDRIVAVQRDAGGTAIEFESPYGTKRLSVKTDATGFLQLRAATSLFRRSALTAVAAAATTTTATATSNYAQDPEAHPFNVPRKSQFAMAIRAPPRYRKTTAAAAATAGTTAKTTTNSPSGFMAAHYSKMQQEARFDILVLAQEDRFVFASSKTRKHR